MGRQALTAVTVATYRVLTDVGTPGDWQQLTDAARDRLRGPEWVRNTVVDVLAYHRPEMTPMERYQEGGRVLRQLGV